MVCWALIDIQTANYRDSPKWEYYAIERCTRKSAIKHLTLNTTWNMLINAFILTSVECTEMHFKQPAKKFLLHAWILSATNNNEVLHFGGNSSNHFEQFFFMFAFANDVFTTGAQNLYIHASSRKQLFSLWAWHVEMCIEFLGMKFVRRICFSCFWHHADSVKLFTFAKVRVD